MTFWRIVIAEDLHRSDHLDSRGVGRNDDDALLAVTVRVVRIALSQHQVYRTSGVTSTADPPINGFAIRKEAQHAELEAVPFVSVNDDLVAFLSDRRADVRRVRRSDYIIY